MRLEDLIKMRRNGSIPDRPVIISLIGRIRGMTWPLILDGDLDPRPFAGLHIIIAHSGREVNRVVELSEKLYLAGADDIETWDVINGRWVSVVSLGDITLHHGIPCIELEEEHHALSA